MNRKNKELIKSNIKTQLINEKRKYIPVNFKRFELFCVECNQSLGVHDLTRTSSDVVKYCNHCANKFIKDTPFVVNKDIVITEDYGNFVRLKYQDVLELYFNCHFNSYGRFIYLLCQKHFI